MKRILFITSLIAIFILSSCGSESSKSDKEESKDEATVEQNKEKSSVGEPIKDCDDFLNKYEELLDKYVDFLKDFQDSPMKAMTNPEFATYSQEFANYAMTWTTMMKCATNEKYAKKFEELGEKYEKAVKDLGIE